MTERTEDIPESDSLAFGSYTKRSEKCLAVVSGIGLGIAAASTGIGIPIIIGGISFAGGMAAGTIGVWEIMERENQKGTEK